MKLPGRTIADSMQREMKKEVKALSRGKKQPHLVTFLVGESAEQTSYVAIKRRVAKELGIKFTFIHITHIPIFEKLVHQIRAYAHDPSVTGVIIQQPLPPQLQTDSIYNFIPNEKEIEGHKEKSFFFPPIGLAVLCVIKFMYTKQKADSTCIVQLKKDTDFFKKILKNKRVCLVGRGPTGGMPISKTLSALKINYINTNSTTPTPEQYYKESDIVITATGKKILFKENIKPGAILINVGLRKEKGKLYGDYDENDIKGVASSYTPTPGGTGPIDVMYLYKNLIEATKMQK